MGNPVGPPRGGTPLLPVPGQPRAMQPGEFGSAARPNLVSFAFDKIGPPSQTYVQRDDVMMLEVISTFADTVTFTIRLLQARGPLVGQPDSPGVDPITAGLPQFGVVQTIKQDVVVQAGQVNSIVQLAIPLTEGYLLSVGAASGIAQLRGNTFARVILNRQINVVGIVSASVGLLLFADYLTKFSPVGWPNGRFLNTIEGPGLIRTVNVANPAAGADWLVAVPSGNRWLIRSIEATLTTSATAGNRQVQIRLRDSGAAVLWLGPPQQNAVASNTNAVSFGQGQVTSSVIATNIQVPLPSGATLEQSADIATVTVGLLAGDQWSNINLQVEQWFIGN